MLLNQQINDFFDNQVNKIFWAMCYCFSKYKKRKEY